MIELAYADTFDPSRTNLIFILIAVGGTAAVGFLVAVIVYIARRRSQRLAQPLITAALFWGFASVITLIAITLQQLAWQKQFQQDLMSGYGDPYATGPGLHPVIWCSLVVIYVAMLAWALLKHRNV